MVQERLLEPTAGLAFVDDTAVRTYGASATEPGTVSRINLTTGQSLRPTRTVEAPITEATTPGFAFIRTLVPMASRQALVSLTQSGFTVIPWSYDAATPIPNLDRIVNAAVCRDDFPAARRKRLTSEAADRASGFRHQECAACDVPGVEVALPESVETARGDVTQVNRR